MKIGLDTSVVVRLLTGEPAPLARAAARRVEQAAGAGAQILVSDLVVAESFFALRHHYGATAADALEALRRIFAESPLRPLEQAGRILRLRDLGTSSPGFVDRLIHAGYRDRVEELWTFDRAGAKLPASRLLGAAS